MDLKAIERSIVANTNKERNPSADMKEAQAKPGI